MGLGDELMCLGRLEKLYEETGKPHSVSCSIGIKRQHPAWLGNPAWDNDAPQSIIDGGGYRPYIKHWQGNRIIFEDNHKARAGKIYLTKEEKDFIPVLGDYVVVAPSLKDAASPNKSWGFDKFQEVANKLGVKCVQLISDDKENILRGVVVVKTKTFRLAASVISRSKLVICNEGGSHHMAASMGVPAVVIFGSFISPETTGYNIHANITTTEADYCGNWDDCPICKKSMEKITPDMVLSKAQEFLRGENAQGIYRV